MAELTSMKYKVITAHNPKTGGTLLRPLVTDRNTMSMKQLVAYAKTAGFVRGQQKDLEGLLGGFIEAMQDRGKAGYSINVNDWFIISGRLKGTVGEDRQLTALNDYHVTISASKDLKVDIDNFRWTRVDDTGVIIKVESITSPGGNKDEIIKTKAIVANGKNLAYDATWGDTVTVTWIESAETKTATLVPVEQSETYLRFDWPSAFATVPVGTQMSFSFGLHGSAEGALQTTTRVVELVSNGTPTAPTITKGYTASAPSREGVYILYGDFVLEGADLADATSIQLKYLSEAGQQEVALDLTKCTVTATKVTITSAAMSSYIEQSLSTQKPKLVVTTAAGSASYEFESAAA